MTFGVNVDNRISQWGDYTAGINCIAHMFPECLYVLLFCSQDENVAAILDPGCINNVLRALVQGK